MNFKKIAIIGNACTGKTWLARALAPKYNLPLTHVDSIQFLPGMQIRDPTETRKILEEIADQEEWIIEGLGPLKIIESRLQKADVIVLIRLPLWLNYWWGFKRQLWGFFSRAQREELPFPSKEFAFKQSLKLVKTIWNVHHGLWPQLDRILSREPYKNKVRIVRHLSELKYLSEIGIVAKL